MGAEEGASAPQVEERVWPMLLLVLLVAVGVRGMVLPALLEQFPLSMLHFVGSDQEMYLAWAREIASGNWLGEGKGAFGFAPLQPYLLALLFKLTGSAAPVVGVWLNACAGVLAALFAALAAWRLFGVLAGGIAGLLVALNGSQIAWEAFLLNDPLLSALLLGGLWLVLEMTHRAESGRLPASGWAWAAGLLLGGAILGRPSNVLPALALWGVLAWRLGVGARAWRAALLPMGLAMALCVAPFVLRNGVMHGVWNVSGNGPINLFLGNNRDALGVFYPAAIEKRKQSTGELRPWAELLQEDLRDNPAYLPPLLWKKTRLFFSAWDIPDNWNSAFSRRHVPLLERLTLPPLLLYLLGALGVALTWSCRRQLLPLYGMGLAFALSIIVVFVAGRFKLPFHGMMAILGGGGAVALVRAFREQQSLRIILGVGALGAGLFLFSPRSTDDELNPQHIFPLRANEYIHSAMGFNKLGLYPRTIALLEPFMKEVAPVFFNDILLLLVVAQMEAGRPQQAVANLEHVLHSPDASVVQRRQWLELRVQALVRYASEGVVRRAVQELLVVAPDHPLGKVMAER